MMTRRWIYTGALLAAVGTWLVFLSYSIYPGPPGGDFYQLWLGARSLAQGQDPYGSAVQAEMLRAYGKWGQHGLPYPLPAFYAIIPLTLLPLDTAMWLWIGLCLLGMATLIFVQPAWRQQVLILLLFVPVFRSVGLRQPTLMWVALAAATIFALHRNRLVLAGLGLALLPAKPQVGLFIAIAGMIWALIYQRRAFWSAIVWGALLWGGAFVLVPNWLSSCLHSILLYRELYPGTSLLPLALIVVLVSYRLPWWAGAAAAQAVMFPIHDVYMTLPLLIAWFAIGGPLAWVGVAWSWSWLVIHSGSVAEKLWVCILAPYVLAAILRAAQGWGYDRAWFGTQIRFLRRSKTSGSGQPHSQVADEEAYRTHL